MLLETLTMPYLKFPIIKNFLKVLLFSMQNEKLEAMRIFSVV